jgi:hypothetical protein
MIRTGNMLLMFSALCFAVCSLCFFAASASARPAAECFDYCGIGWPGPGEPHPRPLPPPIPLPPPRWECNALGCWWE